MMEEGRRRAKAPLHRLRPPGIVGSLTGGSLPGQVPVGEEELLAVQERVAGVAEPSFVDGAVAAKEAGIQSAGGGHAAPLAQNEHEVLAADAFRIEPLHARKSTQKRPEGRRANR